MKNVNMKHFKSSLISNSEEIQESQLKDTIYSYFDEEDEEDNYHLFNQNNHNESNQQTFRESEIQEDRHFRKSNKVNNF